MPAERTLVLINPDGVQRQLTGRILARFEERGLKIVGLKLVHVDLDLAERHYAVHRERPFFGSLVDFITSSPLVAIALEGPGAIAMVRTMVGATRPHEAAPGTIVSIYGPDLNGVTEVLFQGQKAAILAATAGQINAIVPSAVTPGLALLQVRRGGLTSRARQVRISTSAPGLFSLNQGGDGPGIIVHADNFRLVSETEPARRGENLSILCTGLGANSVEPTVTVGGFSAQVTWSGPMPGFPGVDQVNIQVPIDAPRGVSVPLQMSAGNSTSNTVTIVID